MAISTSTNILFFDSTSSAAVTGPQQIIGIFWTEDDASNRDIAADDDFTLTQTSGVRIIGKRAAFAGDDFGATPAKPLIVDGIICTELDGGVCYIWLA